MRIVRPPLLVMQPQRHQSDCTVACLAMYLSVPYEHALLAMGDPAVLRGGAWTVQMQRAADRLGAPLQKVRAGAWDVEHHDGIAQVILRGRLNHVVVAREGLVFDTDLCVWEPADYLAARRGTWGWLLRTVER